LCPWHPRRARSATGLELEGPVVRTTAKGLRYDYLLITTRPKSGRRGQ
jgi:hypothetical protein